MFPVRPNKVQNLLQNIHKYVRYQDEISLSEHSLVGTFQFGKSGINKLKYPNIIGNKQWKAFEKEVRKTIINTSNAKELAPLGH